MEKHAGDQGRIQSLIAGMKSPGGRFFRFAMPFPADRLGISFESAVVKYAGSPPWRTRFLPCRGADALGFMFVEASVRHIGLSDARRLRPNFRP